jgi:hypothetical protein
MLIDEIQSLGKKGLVGAHNNLLNHYDKSKKMMW